MLVNNNTYPKSLKVANINRAFYNSVCFGKCLPIKSDENRSYKQIFGVFKLNQLLPTSYMFKILNLETPKERR